MFIEMMLLESSTFQSNPTDMARMDGSIARLRNQLHFRGTVQSEEVQLHG